MSKKLTYVLGIIAVLSAVFLAVYLPARAPIKLPSTDNTMQGAMSEKNFPAEVGGLKLSGIITGEEANSHISQLHGVGIKVPEAYMAMYGDQNSQLLLYLSRSNNEEEAIKLLQAMDEKMPGNKTFTDYKKVQKGGREMVNVQGAGMDNYYFRQGRAVFWLGVIGNNASNLVDSTLETFKHFS